jgi:hypothetical protein
MNVKELESWQNQRWTKLYESALFELDQVALTALIWEAQAAIRSREQELRRSKDGNSGERPALRRAFAVLEELREITRSDGWLEQAG